MLPRLLTLGEFRERLAARDVLLENALRFGRQDAVIERRAPARGRHEAQHHRVVGRQVLAHQHVDAALALSEAAVEIEDDLVAVERRRRQIALEGGVNVGGMALVAALGPAADQDRELFRHGRDEDCSSYFSVSGGAAASPCSCLYCCSLAVASSSVTRSARATGDSVRLSSATK